MGSRKGCGPDATEPQTAAQNGRSGREGGPQPRSPPQSRPAAPRGTAERGRGRGDRDVQKVNPRPPAGFPPSPMGPWRSSPLTGGAQKPPISSVFTPFGRNPGHLATSQIRTRRLGLLASLQTWPPHKCVSGPHTLSYTNLTQQTDTCSTQSVQIWLFYSKVLKWVRGQRNAPGHAAVPSLCHGCQKPWKRNSRSSREVRALAPASPSNGWGPWTSHPPARGLGVASVKGRSDSGDRPGVPSHGPVGSLICLSYEISFKNLNIWLRFLKTERALARRPFLL